MGLWFPRRGFDSLTSYKIFSLRNFFSSQNTTKKMSSSHPIISLLSNQSELITVIYYFLDGSSIDILALTSSFFHTMIRKTHAPAIYANQLCYCGRVLFRNFNQLLHSRDDDDDKKECLQKFMSLCESHLCENMMNYRSLFVEFMQHPFVFEKDEEDYDWETFLELGGVVFHTHAKPCTFLGILFSQFYTKMQGSDLYTLHKYLLISHVYPLDRVTLRFSEKIIPQPHPFNQSIETLLNPEQTNWISHKIVTLRGAEVLLAMCNDFTHFRAEQPLMKRIILHSENYLLLDYSLMEEASRPHMLPFTHMETYSDIFTMSSGSCYGTDPDLPGMYPCLRKKAFDMEWYEGDGNGRVEHLFQYDWTHIHDDSRNLWSMNWQHAMEFFTFTYYNAKRNQCSVMESNSQD